MTQRRRRKTLWARFLKAQAAEGDKNKKRLSAALRKGAAENRIDWLSF